MPSSSESVEVGSRPPVYWRGLWRRDDALGAPEVPKRQEVSSRTTVGQWVAKPLLQQLQAFFKEARRGRLGPSARMKYIPGNDMKNVIVIIGPGQSGQVIARRLGVGEHVVLADMRVEKPNTAAEVR